MALNLHNFQDLISLNFKCTVHPYYNVFPVTNFNIATQCSEISRHCITVIIHDNNRKKW
jgi:hypothetical protein